MIGKGPNVHDVIEICRSECSAIIQGNWEDGFFAAHTAEKTGGDTSWFNPKNNYYREKAGDVIIEYLGALPHSVEFVLSGKLVRLFHTHPINFNRYFADSSIELRRELFGYSEDSTNKRESDIAVYADIHCVYLQSIDGRILMNCGSVGNPLDITEASYVMLEGGAGFASPSIQFLRVPYDIDKAVDMARGAGIPYLEEYITELRTGRYFKRG